jgi:hypothetical protein
VEGTAADALVSERAREYSRRVPLFKRRSVREKRVTQNDAVYEGRRELLDALVRDYPDEEADSSSMQFYGSSFRCECTSTSCAEPIEISLEDYGALRSEPTHFAVYPGHEDFDPIVSRGDKVVVVFASAS